MRQVYTDLWETRTDSPFPGLTTHAYLWKGAPNGNTLFYSTLSDADFDEIEGLGGIADQYLSHRDEASPTLARIEQRFGARLHAPAAELFEVGRHAHVDVPLGGRHVDGNDVEVISTPGHSPGSTCYLVPGADGYRYLFTGDTMWLSASGTWAAGYIEGVSDAGLLAESLELLATVAPDVVISSAFAGAGAVHEIGDTGWQKCVEQALSGLSASV